MDQASVAMSVVAIGILIVFVAAGIAIGSKRSGRTREMAREAGMALGLDYIEGIEAFRAYYADSDEAGALAWMAKLPEPIRRIMSSGHWWQLAGKRGGVRVSASIESRGKNNTPYTVVRAFYIRELGFELRIAREGVLAKIGKALFGLQDIEIGNPEFDPFLRVKSSDPTAAMSLLGPSDARAALLAAVQRYPAMIADKRRVSFERAGVHLDPGELGAVLDALAAVALALGGGD